MIIDAVSLKPAERQSFAAVAEAAGVPFSGLWLAAPTAAMDGRLRTRRHDASDASPEVLAEQLRQIPGRWTGFASMPAPAQQIACPLPDAL